ncbi:MAG TPA: hypothetical protein VFM49_24300 [Chloroflexia bacterium]|nr:hypothetical protein [Chloroflexia bacterium]
MRVSLLIAILGGVIGVASAIQALMTVGNQPVYQDRAVFGWAALILAISATSGAALSRTRPGVAAVILVIDGLLGLGAMLLFYINTWYALAVPCWLLAAVLLFTEGRRTAQP